MRSLYKSSFSGIISYLLYGRIIGSWGFAPDAVGDIILLVQTPKWGRLGEDIG